MILYSTVRSTVISAVLGVTLALVVVLLPLPAYADEEPPTPSPMILTATPPSPAYAGQQVQPGVIVHDAATSQPVPGAAVLFERSDGLTWTTLGSVLTDATGVAAMPVAVSRRAEQNTLRASLAAQAPVEIKLPLLRRATSVTLSMPRRVVDERSTTLTVRWRAVTGEPVAGPVVVQRRIGSGPWSNRATLTTAADGVARLAMTAREDSRWRVLTGTMDWASAAASAVHMLDNVPPGRPVVLPRKAPRPRVRMPVQPRAVGAGANPIITAIPAQMWRQMVGRTWHSGCPVGRSALRLIEVNYWDYTGYRRRGQVVINSDVAAQIAAALSDLYRHKIPLRSLAREDRFGWSKRVRGANDYRSMAAGNSSAFNCRDVVGRPGIRSPHSWGRSIDLNTWENPYRSAKGIVPNTWWQHRSNKRYAWRSSRHIVVRIMKRHHIRWTYGLGDTQHFDAIPARVAGRAVLNPSPMSACGDAVCD